MSNTPTRTAAGSVKTADRARLPLSFFSCIARMLVGSQKLRPQEVMRVGPLLALIGLALLLFELVLIARILVDLVGVLARPRLRYDGRLEPARRLVYRLTEPVIAPVRRVVRPVQLGGVSFDIALTLVFIAVIVLRQLVLAV
jgi:YggT family protein